MKRNDMILKIAMTGMMAALCYIGFAVFHIDIVAGAGKTAIHFGNAFCVLAALLLGGVYGGAAGAIGMGLADLTSGYVTDAPLTVVLKFIMGLVCGFVFKLLSKKMGEEKGIKRWLPPVISTSCAMALNVVLSPLAGFLYNRYVLGVSSEAADILRKMATATTAFNAVTSVVIASGVFILLYPILKKTGLASRLRKSD